MARTPGRLPVSDWPLIEFGAFLPDQPALTNPGMKYARNIMPGANSFYRPVRRPVNVSTNTIAAFGTPLRVAGSYHSYRDPVQRKAFHFAGTVSNDNQGGRLLRMDDDTGAFGDFSLGAGYTISPNDDWRFANFNDGVFAYFGFGGAPQFMAAGSQGNSFQNIPNAPRAHDVATVREFMAVISVRDDVYGEGFQPYRVWWSAQGDPTNWPDPFDAAAIAPTRSGFQDLSGGGQLQRIIPGIGGADAIIIGERRIWRMSATGGSGIFRFDVVEYDGGTSTPGSVVAYNEQIYLYNDGFKLFDGATMHHIGNGAVDEFFANDVEFDPANGGNRAMTGTIDSHNKLVIWSYRSKLAPTIFNDRIITYNWTTQRWGVGEIGFDAMGRLDTARGATNDPQTFFIGQDFAAQQLTGRPLEAILETKERSANNGMASEVKGIRPIVDADLIYAQARTRDRIAQTLEDTAETTPERDGVCPVNDEWARYFRARVRIPDGEEWTEALGCEMETAPITASVQRAA